MRQKDNYLPFVFIFIICIIVISSVNHFGQEEQMSTSINRNQADTSGVDWFVPKTDKNQRPVFPNYVDSYIEKYNAYVIGSEEKEIYLSFNCGYEFNNYTLDVLDILKEQNVKAVFFITGDYLRSSTDIVKRMKEEGHIVGNHGNTHADLSTLLSGEIKKELVDFELCYKQVMGVDYTDKFFRPASGRFTEESLKIATELNYTTVFWSLSYKDWETDNQPGKEIAYEKIMRSVHPGCILMLHTVSQSNVEALGDAISDLKGQGYTFKSLEGFSQANDL